MKNWSKLVLESNNESSLNNMSVQQARKNLLSLIEPLIKGVFHDEFWAGPKKVWDALKKENIDYDMVKSEYKNNKADPTGMANAKSWNIEFPFMNDKGRMTIIYGILTAYAAGSTKDPFDAYDMTISIN